MGNIPRIGVGVIIRKNAQVLLGKRKNAHGPGSWCPPGGHLEFMETLEACAQREVDEEVGVTIANITRSTITEDFFDTEQKHYITFLMTADWVGGEPVCKEPHKCERWDWFDWDKLPTPLFLCMENQIKQGYNPFT